MEARKLATVCNGQTCTLVREGATVLTHSSIDIQTGLVMSPHPPPRGRGVGLDTKMDGP